MDNKDFHSIIRNALTNYLFELNQSCYEQPECKKATSKCVDYLDSSDEESLAKLRKEREVIIRLKMFYKNHHLDFNNPLL